MFVFSLAYLALLCTAMVADRLIRRCPSKPSPAISSNAQRCRSLNPGPRGLRGRIRSRDDSPWRCRRSGGVQDVDLRFVVCLHPLFALQRDRDSDRGEALRHVRLRRRIRSAWAFSRWAAPSRRWRPPTERFCWAARSRRRGPAAPSPSPPQRLPMLYRKNGAARRWGFCAIWGFAGFLVLIAGGCALTTAPAWRHLHFR